MADAPEPGPPAPRERLRLSNRSIVVAVLILVGAVALVSAVSAATRVLGWALVAAFLAGLLHPIVSRLSRWIPRGVAIALTMLVVVGSITSVVYATIDEVRSQADRLEEVAPDAAIEIERSDRFGEAAREFELRRRVQEFVDDLPERLQGGDTAEALRAAATRGVAFFITGMLTLFLLIHGRRLVSSALRQVHDRRRRSRIEVLLNAAYDRAWRYIVFTVLRALAAGLFTAAVCEVADVPGAILLALWVAIWSLVPLLGVLAGSTAVVLLTMAVDAGRAPAVCALFVAYQVAEVLIVQRRLERASLHVGPVITLVAAMGGLEVYGIGGLLGGVALSIVVASLLRELARGEGEDLIAAADAILPGDEPAAGSVPV
jgi:predicted PurR-regulated permease PerM